MLLQGEAKKLKVIIGENDIVYKRPLYEAIVFAAKKYKIAGVTVFKGVLSYGADSIVHNIKVFEINRELPIIIEMVDREERIVNFTEIIVKLLDKSGCGGIAYIENVEVVCYKNSD